jgi:hypothetical protein
MAKMNNINTVHTLTIYDCAADAAFWAEQQKVAIPGWLREDQKEGDCIKRDILHQ